MTPSFLTPTDCSPIWQNLCIRCSCCGFLNLILMLAMVLPLLLLLLLLGRKIGKSIFLRKSKFVRKFVEIFKFLILFKDSVPLGMSTRFDQLIQWKHKLNFSSLDTFTLTFFTKKISSDTFLIFGFKIFFLFFRCNFAWIFPAGIPLCVDFFIKKYDALISFLFYIFIYIAVFVFVYFSFVLITKSARNARTSTKSWKCFQLQFSVL